MDQTEFEDKTLAEIDEDGNIVIYSGTKTKSMSLLVKRCNRSHFKCAHVEIVIEICGLEIVFLV